MLFKTLAEKKPLPLGSEAAEKARLERLANPTTEELLGEILEILKNK